MENENIPSSASVSPAPGTNSTKPTSVGDWMLTLLVTSIPLVGLIMLFILAFSQTENESKRNWARAILLWSLIGVVVGVLFFFLFFSLFSSTIKSV
jgi:uncharacterized membrane protein YdcZ (DUF606 family)